MSPERFIDLLEELVDVKVQQYSEPHMKMTPEIGRMLQEKRENDRLRVDHIKSELVRILNSSVG